ncbi:M48 family metallopeptidase [Candidatus Gracilibacteria bacterium]|nr:M48 family metallopeptidase [Candidatus Gracilibacteria bacterium]
MSTEAIFYIIVSIFLFETLLTKFLSYLNTTRWSDELPSELQGIYDEEKYAKSQKYDRRKYKFGLLSSSISFLVMLLVLILGGFGALDIFLRNYIENTILLALAFFGVISMLSTLVSLPFSYYATFVIEEEFGFNKMTRKLFFLDTLKSILLSFAIGGILLSLVVWIFLTVGASFWIYAWLLSMGVSLFFMMFYSSLIVPLFNKQTPLEEGELRDAIEAFASKVGFTGTDIYVIDGSKRSSKANAYFSGFGPKKRIVLFDTLIKDLSTEELVAVLAHEIGHSKRRHTLQMFLLSSIQTGLMLYILGLALAIPEVSFALGANESSFHIGVVAFGFLFTPLSFVFGMISSVLSRKNEYEADEYARVNYSGEHLKNALIKLSRNNLSNLRPHPAYEFFYYSHPTVLKRLKALES